MGRPARASVGAHRRVPRGRRPARRPDLRPRAEARVGEAPHGDEGPVYPGTCRALDPAHAAERVAAGERHSLRLRTPPGVERFRDFVHGDVEIDVQAAAGDLVLVRSDGVIGYQLACAVDDAQPQMTHVVRGEDLLASAAFQRVIMRLLDLEPPDYGHVPLMLGPDGVRLAKRHGAITLRDHIAHGATPEGVVGMLAGMFGIGDGSPADLEDLVPLAAGLAG
ncbi:MAG: glutamate--tRNA ligase family protein [Actinomycetota bacterium]